MKRVENKQAGRGVLVAAMWLALTGGVVAQEGSTAVTGRVCGTGALDNPEFVHQAWERTLAEKPGILDAQRVYSLQKSGKQLVVGEVDVFWMFDFTRNVFDTLSAELRATGTECNIWVSLAEQSNGHVTGTEIAAILNSLETTTPAGSRDPNLGIVKLVRQLYGDPPNINADFVKGSGDGITDFLILDIKDGWSGSGSYIAGYFFDVDVDPASGATAWSNRRDMLYIDSYPGITVGASRDPDKPLPVLAHEFQHLVNWNYNSSQTVFFNEGLSEYSEYLCGFGLRSPALYLQEPNVSLLSWTGELADYSRAALWTLYSGEQFGDQFIRSLTQNGTSGIAGFNAALSQSGHSTTFTETARSFFVANIVQDRQAGPAYGYVDRGVIRDKPPITSDILGAVADIGRSGLEPLAAEYVRFRSVDTIRTIVSSGSAPLNVSALSRGDQALAITLVPPGSMWEESFVGSNSSEAIVTVQNASTSFPTSYGVDASGTTRTDEAVEFANDDGFTLTTSNTALRSGDTVFVVFSGVTGGRIDSVRMWFESPGTASLFVRDANTDYDLDLQPVSGLGGAPRMTGGPIPFSVVGTGFLETVVDLRDRNIATDSDFVLEIIYGSGSPSPMLRRDSAQFITRSYLSLASQPTAGRVMYESFGDFYVRVYATATAGFIPPQQQIPSSFRLYVNYPNPFNPSTKIRYDLSADVPVRLVVYDVLGREVATLVDEFQTAGEYEAEWNGRGSKSTPASSGYYVYRLTAGSVSLARLMVLAR